ncbi:MAG: DsrE family protein [Acidimicrobiia bacterium]|nr:DsrE family protein [Acidimicrobiia bacterium]
MAADDKVVIGLTHGADDPERVLIAYLMGVEALRAGKQALMWLTQDGVKVAVKGFVDDVVVPDAPSIPALHDEYVERGGRFYACPVCVKTRGLAEGTNWAPTAEVKGAPSVYEFSAGGALTFNY